MKNGRGGGLMGFVKVGAFEMPSGDINWAAYHAAQKANGEVCSKCNSYFTPFGRGCPSICEACKALSSDEEMSHNSIVRCPACGHGMEVDGDMEVYADGEHSVTCTECDYDFEMQTSVSFSFRSPARIKKEETVG